jgi:hypothetical protein
MADFGDFDPEDEWDDSDPLEVKLRILAKIVESIRDTEQSLERKQARKENALRLLAKLSDKLGEL